MTKQARAIFLDRDGVINRAVVIKGKPYPPANLATMEILPGVNRALISLAKSGFLLIVITNQPDVARGVTLQETVDEINNHLKTILPITEIRCCFHDDSDHCCCRKPKPYALLDAAKKYQLNLRESYMVGDRWRDIEAGQRAGCKTIFIDYGYDEQQPLSMDFRVKTLGQAAEIILGERCENN